MVVLPFRPKISLDASICACAVGNYLNIQEKDELNFESVVNSRIFYKGLVAFLVEISNEGEPTTSLSKLFWWLLTLVLFCLFLTCNQWLLACFH